MVKTVVGKTFWRGPLKGMFLEDTLSHVSVASAVAWYHGVKRNSDRGVLDYWLVSGTVYVNGEPVWCSLASPETNVTGGA